MRDMRGRVVLGFQGSMCTVGVLLQQLRGMRRVDVFLVFRGTGLAR